jgi:predicted permease
LGDYFSELFIDVNRPFRFEPRPLTVAMIARLMPAAINPYSIAVAADWSAKNLENVVFISHLLVELDPDFYRFARWNLSFNR